MKEILFLAHRIPFPPDRGDKIRSWHLLRHLANFARVHLACFADDEEDAAHLPALRARLGDALGEAHVEVRRRGKAAAGARALIAGKPVSLTLFDSAGLRRFVHDRIERGDIEAVFAFSGQMAQFVPQGLAARFVMDFGDVDSAKFEQYADDGGGPMRWVNRREAAHLARFERATAARADVTTFVSEAEAALFRSRTGLTNVHALSNGIDLGFFDPEGDFEPAQVPDQQAEPLILFTGQMDYPPNAEAVAWFATKVMPKLKRGRFVIAGRNPTPEVRRLAGPRVTVTGSVPDIRSWLSRADVVVAPLRLARGIQNKVLEAMAMGRPVVASAAAFEGIEAEPGRDLLVASEAEAMATAINHLLERPEEADLLGRCARRRMEQSYAWDARLAPLESLVFPAVQRAAA